MSSNPVQPGADPAITFLTEDDVLNFFHWLGAVITNPKIIRHKGTPVRRVIDRAAALVPSAGEQLSRLTDPPDWAQGETP